ncbi:Heparin-sulfate lyase N-terminal domain-containing protein [Candidatus Magnetomoraceae bacterium gMMP-15]
MLKYLIPTIARLGFGNIVTVLIYRLLLRFGLIKKVLPTKKTYCNKSLFNSYDISDKFLPDPYFNTSDILEEANKLIKGNIPFFSNRFLKTGSPPEWFLNPINNKKYPNYNFHWSKLGDFDQDFGDIKLIWELSRFDWALIFARAYRVTNDKIYLETLNHWISDWIENNPLNIGPNWKCGQETAIRMMQVLLAAYLLKQHTFPSNSLKNFVIEHCSRIAPTIYYAIAQDNNHGTSEAAGLYIGSAWLMSNFRDKPEILKKAKKWHQSGLHWLENRVLKLIAQDGSFSQYSLNYHRVMLDTLNMAEFWRRELNLPEFSEAFYNRAKSAVKWLYDLINPLTGDGPNLGANDGAYLFKLSSSDYCDYRPSVQLGTVLFFNGKAYPKGSWDEPLFWLGLDKLVHLPVIFNKKSRIMKHGGYVTMNFDTSFALIRFPNFCFRPAHADAFHFDLWYNDINLLRDSGSYSYNAEEHWQNYFPGTISHNTVQFDEHDQMPRLGRFLFGSWLKMQEIGELIEKDEILSWTGAYKDYKGCWHKRTILSNGLIWKIIDEIDGFKDKAVLRWRLAPGNWQINYFTCTGNLAELSINSNVPITRFELVDGWESRYYMEKTKLPVLEIQVESAKAILISEIHFR